MVFMKIIGITFLLICNSVFASSTFYDLKMELSLNGKHAHSPRIIVKEGLPATFTIKNNDNDKETFIDVIATKAVNDNAIMMEFKIGTIDKDGERTILASPKVIANENQATRISQNEHDGQEQISLTVTAKKQIQ